MIWGMTLHPGAEFTRKVHCDEHLTLASLECRADKSIDGGRPSSCLLLKTGRGQHVLCTLEEGVMNQQCLDLILEQGEKITFLVEGTGIVYLTGYTSRRRQHEVSWSIGDTEGSNTQFEDSFQGNTDNLSEKDLSDDGDDMMHEVSGSHGEDGGNHSDNDGYHSDNNDDFGDDDVQDENDNCPSDTGDDHVEESTGKDDNSHNGSDNKVVEGSVDTIVVSVEGSIDTIVEPGNRDHQENDPVGLDSDKQDGETSLSQEATQEAGSENITVSPKSKRSDISLQGKSRRVTSSRRKGDNRSSTKTREYRCFICLESFPKKAECTAHENICHKGALWRNRSKEPHRCKFCGKAFDRPSEKTAHEATHKTEKLYGCRLCEKRFKTTYTARRHERTHTKERYKCQLCPKTYISSGHLEDHMRSHTGEKPYACHKCPTFFSTLGARNRHIRGHETRFPFQCKICGKGLSSEKRLAEHEKIHTQLPTYTCRYCDMAFVRFYHRSRHEKMTHSS